MMKDLQFVPNLDTLSALRDLTPWHMVPTALPDAVYLEGALDDVQCQEILKCLMTLSSHSFPGCDAQTRDFTSPLPGPLDAIRQFGELVNDSLWCFHINRREPAAYLQTYEVGDGYALHMDAHPGQSRKLTVVALLTPEYEYADGNLILHPRPGTTHVIPKTRGTLVAFPSWVIHEVTPVTQGIRQTVNLGFWGPPFR